NGTLFNYGTIVQTGTGWNVRGQTTIDNEPGGSYLIETDGQADAFVSSLAVINAGSIVKTAGTGTTTLLVGNGLTNTGTIEADSGTLYVNANNISEVSGSTLTGGTWNADNGATLELPPGTAITSSAGNLGLGGA